MSTEAGIAPVNTGLQFDEDEGDARARAAGVTLEESEYTDYFGFVTTHRYFLPDGKQFFEYKTLNEGEIAAYQSAGSSEVVVQRKSGDAKMKVDQGGDRHRLIKASLVGWNLMRKSYGKWSSVNFTPAEVNNLLREFDPTIIAGLEKAIRKSNPSISGERTVADIQDEINSLNDELDEAKKREMGKDVS